MNVGITERNVTKLKKIPKNPQKQMKGEKVNENVKVEAVQDLHVHSGDNLKDAKEATCKKEEILLRDASDNKDSEAIPSSVVTGHLNCLDVDYSEHEDTQMNKLEDSVDSPKENSFEKDPHERLVLENHSDCISQGVDDERIKVSVSCTSDTRESTNKKLSVSAAPFNPSPSPARIAPLPMNLTLPAGPGTVPGIGPWTMNVPLHPGPGTVLPGPICSSPHHPYPSPSPTPNIIHTMPIMYSPPYNLPPNLPLCTYPITSGPFHPNHFAWQCNMNHGTPDYIPATVWLAFHPIEFSLSPPVVEPIAELYKESKRESDNSDNETLALASNLPADLINTGDVDNTEVILPVSEEVETLNNVPAVPPNGNAGKCG